MAEKTQRTVKEYGGFLPLELNPGKEYFEEYGKEFSRYNSFKAAINELLSKLGCKIIYIPYYYCPSTIMAIKKTGIEISYYHIDESFNPVDLDPEDGSAILLVNYFGICGEKLKNISKKYNYCEIIFDFAHSFFEKPVLGDHIHNIFSAKKFFGVPDGAYLISKVCIRNEDKFSKMGDLAKYLCVAYEEGTNASYNMKKEVDSYLFSNYSEMSSLSVGLLQNVDYERVKKQRIENYDILYKSFKDINELAVMEECAAYQFPLLIREKGRKIKSHLVSEKIYVSTLWSGEDLIEKGNDFELSMMNDCIFLPIDQRYRAQDMEYIKETVKRMVNMF